MQLHLLDATYELFRAHFGRPPHAGADGSPAGATLGVVESILSLLREDGVTHLACAHDHRIRSWRNDRYPGYKTEEGMPLRRLLEVALYDVSVVTYPAYEATEAGLRGMQQVAEGDLMTFFDRLITQDITPASLPVLRAAREALATRLDAADPHEKQSEVEAPRSMDIRHRFNARKVEADTWI